MILNKTSTRTKPCIEILGIFLHFWGEAGDKLNIVECFDSEEETERNRLFILSIFPEVNIPEGGGNPSYSSECRVKGINNCLIPSGYCCFCVLIDKSLPQSHDLFPIIHYIKLLIIFLCVIRTSGIRLLLNYY